MSRVESCKIVLMGTPPIHLFRHLLSDVSFATIHSVTDGRTVRRTDDIIMPIDDHDHTACSTIGKHNDSK